jgi:hypothetical protein
MCKNGRLNFDEIWTHFFNLVRNAFFSLAKGVIDHLSFSFLLFVSLTQFGIENVF